MLQAVSDHMNLPEIDHTVQVTSFGGSGTTMLLEFLQAQGVEVPREPDWGIWKHLPSPPTTAEYVIPADFRAVYLISDPVDALLSVFRRRFHIWHALRMQSKPFWPSGFRMEDSPEEPNWGMREFLALNADCFGLERQFSNWTNCPYKLRGYAMMVIKYERLWDNLPRVLDFVGLPKDRLIDFPARRDRTTTPGASDSDRAALEVLYERLRDAIASLPECSII
jgi:hypothetical protein